MISKRAVLAQVLTLICAYSYYFSNGGDFNNIGFTIFIATSLIILGCSPHKN